MISSNCCSRTLKAGDIIIDGGNSNYNDSIRRTAYVESKGLLFIGTGVSGGEEGARHGPSIMPGGSPAAWPHVQAHFPGRGSQGHAARMAAKTRAATGSARTAPGTMSRWCITASNTATCS